MENGKQANIRVEISSRKSTGPKLPQYWAIGKRKELRLIFEPPFDWSHSKAFEESEKKKEAKESSMSFPEMAIPTKVIILLVFQYQWEDEDNSEEEEEGEQHREGEEEWKAKFILNILN